MSRFTITPFIMARQRLDLPAKLLNFRYTASFSPSPGGDLSQLSVPPRPGTGRYFRPPTRPTGGRRLARTLVDLLFHGDRGGGPVRRGSARPTRAGGMSRPTDGRLKSDALISDEYNSKASPLARAGKSPVSTNRNWQPSRGHKAEAITDCSELAFALPWTPRETQMAIAFTGALQ
jgi:hypothetical protein